MKLYRYRELGESKDDSNVEKMLINSEIYLNNPKDFNDPFDCKTNTVYHSDDYNEWYKLCVDNGLNEAEADRLASSMMGKKLTNEDLLGRDIDRKIYAINCFSEVNDSILMWSHYANAHKGICIEYSPCEELGGICFELVEGLSQIHDPVLNRLLGIVKVNYQMNMPLEYNRLKDDSKKLIEFLRTKHSDWKYEKEWRILLVQEQLRRNPIIIKRKQITGIIFGLLIDDSYKKKYLDICNKEFVKKGYDFKFYQCYEKNNEYGLNIKEIIQ